LGALALKVGGGSGSPAQCWPCCAGGQQRACGSPSRAVPAEARTRWAVPRSGL